jgi:hypothetical protein
MLPLSLPMVGSPSADLPLTAANRRFRATCVAQLAAWSEASMNHRRSQLTWRLNTKLATPAP